jgi:membrane-anchored protein YejM (alkaline phosphatase superfamily)
MLITYRMWMVLFWSSTAIPLELLMFWAWYWLEPKLEARKRRGYRIGNAFDSPR